MINVNKNNEQHKQIIFSDHLFHKGPRSLLTMSMADIPVLHTVEVYTFTVSRDTHMQGLITPKTLPR